MEQDIQLEEVLEQNEEYKKQSEELNYKIENLIEKNEKEKEKNNKLTEQINNLISEQKKIEVHMDRVKKDSTLSDISIEPSIYLKGMFDYFDKEQNALVVLIEGRENYYPLKSYQCAHLPISGSRVLIFRSNQGEYLIYGFDISKIIEPSKKIKAEIKSLLSNQNKIKLYTQEYGFINTEVTEKFFSIMKLKLGDHVVLNQVYIDGDYYFSINEETQGKSNRDTILKTLLKEQL